MMGAGGREEGYTAPPTAGPGLAVQMLTAGTAACFADLVTFPLDTVSGRTRPRRELLRL